MTSRSRASSAPARPKKGMLERDMNSEVLDLASLSDDQLLTEMKRLAACERRATAALLRSLMEVDSRRLYLREGCSSLFTYCTQVLHLSEGAAYNRIEAARAARRFPSVLTGLEDGSLTLASVRLLAPHFTTENHGQLMAAARHKSKREVELLVATLAPKRSAPTVLRRLPEKPPATPAGTVSMPTLLASGHPPIVNDMLGVDSAGPRATSDGGLRRVTSATAPAPRSAGARAVTPLSAAHYRLQVTMTQETHDKLRRAQDLLRHAVPTGDIGAVLDRALTLLVADLERRRCAATPAPRDSSSANAGGRHIPSAVRRAVWKRDAGRCAFVGTSGRCTETGWLEFITCIRTRRAAVRRSRTFSCAAGRTTSTRRGSGLERGVTKSGKMRVFTMWIDRRDGASLVPAPGQVAGMRSRPNRRGDGLTPHRGSGCS